MKKDDCIFCRIAAGQIPSMTVYEDERVRAILDLNPAAEGHTLVIPKDHYDDVFAADEETVREVFATSGRVAAAVRDALGADGINIIQNNGTAAGQTVPHLHVHIIPRYEGGERMLNWTQHESDPARQDELRALIAERLEP